MYTTRKFSPITLVIDNEDEYKLLLEITEKLYREYTNVGIFNRNTSYMNKPEVAFVHRLLSLLNPDRYKRLAP